MKREELLLSAMGDMEDDFLMEANDYNKKKRRCRGAKIPLIAACMVLFVVTASAVGVTMHQRARADMGIVNTEDIPEYTEYSAVESPEVFVPEEPVETVSAAEPLPEEEPDHPWILGGEVQLVSAFCSGNEVVAYVSIPNVTAQMQAQLDSGANWDFGGIRPQGYGWSAAVFPVEYDAETETALVKVLLDGNADELDSVGVALTYRYEQDGKYGILYDQVDIPITQSTSLYAEIGQTVKSSDVDVDFEVVDVEVYAGYVAVNLKTKPMEQFYADLGDDAYTIVGNAIFREPIDPDLNIMVSDAYFLIIERMFDDMQEAPGNTPSQGSMVADATLNFADGSSILISEQESLYAGWHSESNLNETIETGEILYQYTFSTPLVLTEVESITILGETYLLTGK